MKKLVLSIFVLTMAVAVQAQEPKKEAPEKRKHHHEMAFDKLNLSEEQKAKFKSENEAFRKQMSELKKNESMTVKDHRSKMESLRKDHQSKMDGLLTPDQKLQMEKMRADRKSLHEKGGREHFQKMRGDRKSMHEKDGKDRIEKMKANLGLSDDQAAKMNKNRTELTEKMKALRSDEKLGADVKKEKMKELMKEHKEKTKSILSEEQLKKLKEGDHDRKGKRSPRSTVI